MSGTLTCRRDVQAEINPSHNHLCTVAQQDDILGLGFIFLKLNPEIRAGRYLEIQA